MTRQRSSDVLLGRHHRPALGATAAAPDRVRDELYGDRREGGAEHGGKCGLSGVERPKLDALDGDARNSRRTRRPRWFGSSSSRHHCLGRA